MPPSSQARGCARAHARTRNWVLTSEHCEERKRRGNPQITVACVIEYEDDDVDEKDSFSFRRRMMFSIRSSLLVPLQSSLEVCNALVQPQ